VLEFKIFIPEWKKEATLKARDDARSFLTIDSENMFFMVKRDGSKILWATLKDFNSDKDGLIPPIDVTQKELSGDWKKTFETEDIILDVDNKSITHRPDMWGHRGFAREIAAYMDLPFMGPEKYLAKKDVFTYDKKSKTTDTSPIAIEIDESQVCRRFAGLYFSSIENRPTNILMLSRLLKVGVRPINGIVDITNAYDAEKIEGGKIIVRFAKKGEKLTILDGTKLELTDQDLLIADKKKGLCLGGVMGGYDSGIGKDTKSIFFESANFNAAVIRRTAMRYGCRTESSIRFEKTLDPNQNIEGILRFLKLSDDCGIKYKCADEILSVGIPAQQKTLQITHEYFERRSGLELHEFDITVPLKKMGFEVATEKMKEDVDPNGRPQLIYNIKIPTYRSSKDIEIKEDILEEIVRYYGFDKIEPVLPLLQKQPAGLTSVMRSRLIKSFFANSAKMTEQQNYIFYDEPFIAELGYEPKDVACEVVNAPSVDQRRLVKSLLPNLFKNIKENFVLDESLNFFELARTWHKPSKKISPFTLLYDIQKERKIVEYKRASGIFFNKRKTVDFYECKQHILDLLSSIRVDLTLVEWKQIEKPSEPWVTPYQSAEIYFDGNLIGVAGKVEKAFLNRLDVLPESDAFFFELEADFLLNYKPETATLKELPRYQETFLDFSVFVPLTVTTSKLEKQLAKVDSLITDVKLIDFFEREEWLDKRSLTFRVRVYNPEKTIGKEEIDAVWKKAVAVLEKNGASLRG